MPEKEIKVTFSMEHAEVLEALKEMLQSTSTYEEKVEETARIIQHLADTSDLSFQKVSAEIRKVTEDISVFGGTTEKIASDAVARLNTELKKTGETGTQVASILRGGGQQIVSSLQQTINSSATYQQKVEATANAIRRLAEIHKMSFQEISRELRKLDGDMKVFGGTTDKIASDALTKLNSEAKGATQSAGGLAGAFGQLGTVGQFVIGSVLGVSLVGVLRNIVNWFSRAIEQAQELATGLFRLEVATRGLQRRGQDVSIQQFRQLATQTQQDFPAFTEFELQNAIGQIALYGREVGITGEQIASLTEVSAAFAQITGDDVASVALQAAKAAASGYTEGLQRMGFSISRLTVEEEAHRQGLNKSFLELTENERATITLSLVQQQAAAVLEDLTKFQETYAGKIATTEGAVRRLSQTIGTRLLPVKGALSVSLLRAVEGFTNFFNLITVRGIQSLAKLGAGLITLRLLLDGQITSLEQFSTAFRTSMEQITQDLFEDFFPELSGEGDLGEDQFGSMAENAEEAGEETTDIIADLQQKINEEMLKGQQRREQMEIDHLRKLEELRIDHNNRIAELERDKQEKIWKINFDFTEDWLDLNEDEALKEAEINRSFDLKLQELEEKRREREIDAERKFLERLRQLRENFLLDLEDAVRERDALQIIRLTRQFNLRKQQLERQRQQERQDINEDAENQRRDLERQRAERLRQLEIEFAVRRERLQRQHEIELMMAERAHDRQLEELMIDQQEREAELNRRYEQELSDLDTALEDRLELILLRMAEEQKLTQQNAEAVFDTLNAYYGPGGLIENLYLYTVSLLQDLENRVGNVQPVFMEPIGDPIDFEEGIPVHGFAQGGTLIARKPTLAMFGEAGAERVDFTPLGRPGFANRAAMGSGQRGAGGMIRLLVSMSPGLVGEIVDQTLDEASNIYFEVERGRTLR